MNLLSRIIQVHLGDIGGCQKIDAEIDVKLTQVGLNKALGILQ